MNEEDVVRYWEHMAEEWDPSDGDRVVFDSLVSIAGNNPHLLRGAIEAAARAIGRRFCTHGETAPEALPDIKKLKSRVEAAQEHPGLCGVHHAGYIGSINYQDVLDRMPEGGGPVTTKKMRNQACYQASTGLNARGKGVQLSRRECFTYACRAVWPGDEPLPEAMVEALLQD